MNCEHCGATLYKGQREGKIVWLSIEYTLDYATLDVHECKENKK